MKEAVLRAVVYVELLLVAVLQTAAIAEEVEPAKPSADAVAKELANPAGSLASLKNAFEFRDYAGDLRGADDQDGWTYSFQPVLPFPVGDTGHRIIFRPLLPVKLSEPVFKKTRFDDEGPDLGDTTFDLVYAGTRMRTAKEGLLWGLGLAGTLPTASDDDFAGDQWRFGPELFGGLIREWGLVGGLFSHQWDTGGADGSHYSVSALQYFYAYGLGNGWQISSSPTITLAWQADGDDQWSVPLGVGLAKTTIVGALPIKFQFEVQKYVAHPDSFGPDWLAKLTITPVIENPFVF